MEKFYLTITTPIYKYPLYKKILYYISHISTGILFLYYPCLLVCLYIVHHPKLWICFIKPAIVFGLVTVFRYIINRKRPYDIYSIYTLEEHKHGQSFPSRHTASAVIIALVSFEVGKVLGVSILVLAIIIAISRLLGGLHFISDILAGILISILIWLL